MIITNLEGLNIEQVNKFLVSHKVRIRITSVEKRRVAENHKALQQLAAQQLVYGVNTGFGPMANYYIAPAEQATLQYNLIRSHACGLGEALSREQVRVIMLVRLATLMQSYSGVSWAVITQLRRYIELDITPIVPEHGSVGASGDLVQLAHIALTLIGEGEVLYKQQRMKTTEALAAAGIKSISLNGRDGLALINGTAAMTGIAALNVIRLTQYLHSAVDQTACLYELFSVHTECIHETVSKVRPHPGQQYVSQQLRTLLADSNRVRSQTIYPFPEKKQKTSGLPHLLQDAYSLRCVPQILGPMFDTLAKAKQVVEVELTAVTDNPLIASSTNAIHNGNFHGDYVAQEMDFLRISIAKLSVLLERQLNILVNPKLNGGLPPYGNRGTIGLDLSLQATQFIATSTTAENQTLATPLSIHSISTNNDNQDVVSMGTNSALLTARTLTNLTHVQAVLWLAIAQQIDVLQLQKKLPSGLHKKYKSIRQAVPELVTDRVLSTDLEAIVRLYKEQKL